MSLKRPKDVPKIPKAREKTIDKLKDATPKIKPKESEIEYNCFLFFHKDTKTAKQKYAIIIDTVKQFTALNYELTVLAKKNKNVIDISILGLKNLDNYRTEVKPASAEIYFDDLFGKITVNVIKQDGSINSGLYEVNVYKKHMELIEEFLPPKKNNRKFCSFFVDKKRFSFEKEGLL
jgi:hypothetical protein